MVLFTNTYASLLKRPGITNVITKSKLFFKSKDLDVIVEECNSHEHILKDDYVDSNQVYRWSPVIFGMKSGESPKVIYSEKGCFSNCPGAFNAAIVQ